MPSTILDAFGQPATFLSAGSSNGQLYQRTSADERLRPKSPVLYGDYLAMISPQNLKRLISESRQIASVGEVKAAIWQKADYLSASDWRTHYHGANSDWGDEVEQLCEDTQNNICTRGDRFPWRSFWRMAAPTMAADGGFFILLTSSDSGWPLLQPIEAHRIGQRGTQKVVGANDAWTVINNPDGTSKRVQGAYVGMKIENGIIYNPAGGEVAYRVLGLTQDDDMDVSARDMIHVGEPNWFSEGRPLPQITPALLDLYGISEARSAQLDGQILDAKMTFVETNETGRQDPIRQAVNPNPQMQTVQGANPEVIERGYIRYVKAGSGRFEVPKSNRPSSEWMGYDERLSGIAIAAIGWRKEMLDPSNLKGAATRGFQDQINTTIRNGFMSIAPAVIRCRRYMVAKWIKLGIIPPDPDFLKWKVAQPPDFTVDRGQLKTDLDGVRTGAEDMPSLQRRLGYRPREVLEAQAKYEVMKDEIADKYDIAPQRLGSLTIPGDKAGYTTGQDIEADPDNNNPPTTVAQP